MTHISRSTGIESRVDMEELIALMVHQLGPQYFEKCIEIHLAEYVPLRTRLDDSSII